MRKMFIPVRECLAAAAVLLAILPVSALAENGIRPAAAPATVSNASRQKATSTNASRQKATASDAGKEELWDGEVENDLKSDPETEMEPEEVKNIPEKAVPEKAAAEDISGTWTVDGVTIYQFRENGTGVLMLPEHSYSFTYTAEGDELELDFDDPDVGEAVFRFEGEEDRLNLERVSEYGIFAVTLQKEE